MAIYHLHASTISRSNGHSVIAAGAYQARENLSYERHRISYTTIDLSDLESKKQFSLDKRTLTKGEISDNLKQEFHDNGIELSDDVTITRDNRRQWTITDGDNSYIVREYRKTTTYTDENDKTKQSVIGQGLDIHGKKEYNYAEKGKEDLVKTWIQTPDEESGYETPDWLKDVAEKQDRQTYYSKMEQAEERRDSATALRFEVALPREFSTEQNEETLRAWGKQFTDKGAAVDVAIHETTAVDGKPNPHAHILVSTRVANETGFEDKKNPELAVLEKSLIENEAKRKENLKAIRKSWADTLNERLDTEEFGFIKVSHETLEKQGIERDPEIHLGKEASLEQKGIETEKGDKNEWIKAQNQIKAEGKAKAEEIRKEREEARQEREKEQAQSKEKDTEKTNWQRVKRLSHRFLMRRHEPLSHDDKMLRRERRIKASAHAVTVVKEWSKYVAQKAKRLIPKRQIEAQPEKEATEKQAQINHAEKLQQERVAAEKQQAQLEQEKRVEEAREKQREEDRKWEIKERVLQRATHTARISDERNERNDRRPEGR